MRRVWDTFRRHPRLKLVRYALSGIAVSTGYTLTVLLLVEDLGWRSPSQASAASFLMWTPISYIAQRDFTFLYRGRRLAALVKFLVAFLARFGASMYTVYLATAVLGLPYLAGVMANWVVLPLIAYVIMDLWVFRAPARPAQPSS
jgi:putative flippase GtrA